ncbi:MAG: nicotinate (nicotinamide) nucleotide adenylyltransferase [Oscillospiraceae bacterium]|nr:nicotinate (nicotinamide) nucleotide adenylyltransferase [Oscillospiraceae bacterium]
MASKRLLFYGGSFDPPHTGHRELLKAAMRAVEPDLTLVIPTGLSPFKNRVRTSFWDRVRMSRLTFSGMDNVRVSTIEGRGWRSYTMKTVRKLLKKYPGYELFMLIGSDMLTSFSKWHLHRRIMANVTLVAGGRDDEHRKAMEAAAVQMRKDGGKVMILSFDPVDISSTRVRQLIESGADVSGFVSREVQEHIRKRGLYR